MLKDNLSTRKWKDEQSGQDKYSTEIVIQGYNSSLTMLGGGNSRVEVLQMIILNLNNNDDSCHRFQTTWMMKFHFNILCKNTESS